MVELMIVIAVVLILMSLIQPALRSAREQAFRADCLTRLKHLFHGWNLYSEDNNDLIIGAIHTKTNPWLPQVSPSGGLHWPIKQQKELIQSSLMYEYIESFDAYGCVNREDYAVRTFTMSHPMNGNFSFLKNNQGVLDEDMYTKQSQIDYPAERMTIIDDWNENYDNTYAIYRTHPQWWNPLPIRHGQGATMIYADGHANFYQFRDPRTLEYNGTFWVDFGPHHPGNEDIHYLATAIYGPNSLPWKL